MLTKHILDADHVTHMKNAHFQLGYDAFQYLRTACQLLVGQLRMRELNKEFDDIDIIHDIGINPNTIMLLCKKVRTANGKRPAAHRRATTS